MSDSPLQLTFGARQRAFLTAAADFNKQRTRITRRVHRTRRYLKIQSKDTKKYRSKEISTEDYDGDDKYYILGLMNVEKDFLYALELRAQADLGTTNVQAKQKLLVTRLKRALERSESLLKVSQNEKGVTKRIELLVYTELLRAHFSVSTKKWSKAIDAYSIARCALQLLEDKGPRENRILYKDIIEENIDEPLKLSIYRDSKVNSADLTEYTKKIVESKFTSHEIYTLISSSVYGGEQYLKPTDESELVKEIQWRDYTARVKDETTSRLLSRADKIELDSLDAYDTKMALLQDALDNHHSFISRSIQDDEEQDDQILLAYINYTLLLTRAQRDKMLLDHASKKEAWRIVDTIKATIKEAEELPGVYSDDELFANLEFIIKYFDSYKLNLLTEIFAQRREYTKALTLATESLKLVESIKFTVSFPNLVTDDEAKELTDDTRARQRQLHVLTEVGKTTQTQAVANNINVFPTSHEKLVSFELEQVASKPVLFDLAYNFITNPVAQKQTTRESTPVPGVSAPSEEKKKGLFGFFR